MAITLPVSIPSTATDALQPVDEFLMKGIDTNQKYIASQIEPGGGGGGDTNISVSTISNYEKNKIASIAYGGKDNSGGLSRVRYSSYAQEISDISSDGSSVDVIGNDLGKRKRWCFPSQQDFTWTSDTMAFRGTYVTVPKNISIFIEIKEGENFFAIGRYIAIGQSDKIEVFIDGKTPTELNLKDESGNPAPNFFSTNSGNPHFGVGAIYTNLDGLPHVLEIKNSDSATKTMVFDYIDFGFIPKDYTITNKIKLESGITNTGAEFQGGEFSFDDSTYTGHTGALVLRPDKTVYSLNGTGPITTKVSPLHTIDFPNRPTSLKVQGNYMFPDTGICLLTLSNGNNYVFSYSGKTTTDINNNLFTGIIWDSIFDKQFIAQNTNLDFTANAEPTLDCLVNYYGDAPILITNLNNKIDFALMVNGVQTTYSVTIPNGGYSASLMSFGKKLSKLMKDQANIKGEFSVSFNSEKDLWNISVIGEGITELKLLFNSGPSYATSVGITLGFNNADYIGETFYTSEITKQHLSYVPFRKGPAIDYTSPKVKFGSSSYGAVRTNAELAKKEIFTGWTIVGDNGTTSASDQSGDFKFFPSPDAVGMEITFIGERECGGHIQVQIDNHAHYCLSTYYAELITEATSKIYTYMISFPKFTPFIKFHTTNGGLFIFGGTVMRISLQFIKELYSRPAFEKLLTGEKILKTFDIAPFNFYAHIMGNMNGAYVPQGTNDPIKSYSEGGTWVQNVSAGYIFLFYYNRYSVTQNSYIDVKFEIKKDGGGIAIYNQGGYANGGPHEFYRIYLTNAAAINESTDYFDFHTFYITTGRFIKIKTIRGLKAGTYIIRIKKTSVTHTSYYSGFLGFGIIDGKLWDTEQPSANTLNYYSVPIPISRIDSPILKDDEVGVTASEERANVSPSIYDNPYCLNFIAKNSNWTNYDSAKTSVNHINMGFESVVFQTSSSHVDFDLQAIIIGKEVSVTESATTTFSESQTVYLNNKALYNSLSSLPFVKNGYVGSIAGSAHHRLIKSKASLEKLCSYSTGDTYLTSITSSLRIGNPIILFDGTNSEQVNILSVVTNTSFTTSPSTLITKASVTKFFAYGVQMLKYVNNQNNIFGISSFIVVPLSITKNKYIETFREKERETAVASFKGIATSTLSFPRFKDGSRGSAQNTVYQVTAISTAATYYSINLSSSVVVTISGGGTIDLQLTSIR